MSGRGTEVILHVKKAEEKFLDKAVLQEIIHKYSDHINLPIILDDEGKQEKLNQATALWMRGKTDITPVSYTHLDVYKRQHIDR